MKSGILGGYALLALAVAACSQAPAPSTTPGSESFLTQGPAGGSRGGATAGAVPATASPTPDAAATVDRTVEEADLYRLSADGRTLLVLNGFRGLQLVDLSNLDAPALVGRVPAVGRPLDLYVRSGVAYFTVSDAVTWGWAAGDAAVRPTGSSQLWVVDVADPQQPAVLSRLDLEGSAVETRIVGDVLYVFSQRRGWWDVVPVASGSGGTAVALPWGGASAGAYALASFDLRDPRHPVPVASVALDATGWELHASVTPERITLAQSGWDARGEVTTFSVYDVSDPGGAIVPGATFDAPGRVPDRWAMDFDASRGVFSAVLATGWNGGARLQLWSTPAPGAASALGAVSVGDGEGLTAARFDGARAYVVTARAIDPLFVIDTSDPRDPRVRGELVMPGQLDFLEPRGTRLLALGHTGGAGQPWQLALSIFDVTEPAALRLDPAARVTFGDGSGWVPVSRDDMRKALQVLDGEHLVLVPFQGWDAATYRWVGGVQLIELDLAGAALAKRGFLAHPGDLRRAFPLAAPGQLAALSDQRLQLIDASDRDAPRERSGIDLARPVVDIGFVAGRAIALAGDGGLGDTALVVTEPLDPDAPVPLARVALPAPNARMFLDDAAAWVLATDWRAAGPASWLQGVDLSDPVHPVPGPALDVAAPSSSGWSWGWGDEAVRTGTVLAVHRQRWRYVAAGVPTADGGAGAGPGSASAADELLLYDLANVAAPRLAGRLTLPGSDWAWGLTEAGGSLWITHFTWDGERAGYGRYWLDRVDASRPDAPRLAATVNVPGTFVGARAGGERVYTVETVWPDAVVVAGAGGVASSGSTATGTAASPQTLVHALDLTGSGTARLAASVALDGAPSGVVVEGGTAYLALARWTGAETRTALAAVDLAAMALASSQEVASAWAVPLRATGGKLFLSAWAAGGSTVLVYGLADPGRPAFEQAVASPGWARTVAVWGGRAYLPAGAYGVQIVPLAP